MVDDNMDEHLFDDVSVDEHNILDNPDVANMSNSEFVNMSFYDNTDISDSATTDVPKNTLLFRAKQDYRFANETGYHKIKSFKGTEGLNVLNDYTVMVWVYPERLFRWHRIFGKGQSSIRNFGVWVDKSGYPLSQSGCLSSGWNALNRHGPRVPLKKWTLLSAIFRKDKYHVLYMNGRQIATDSTRGTPCRSPEPIVLGGYLSDSRKPETAQMMYGHTQEARLYNYVIRDHDRTFKNLYLRNRATSVPTSRPTGIPTPRPPTGTPTPSPTMGQFGTIYQLLNSLIDEGNTEIADMDKAVKDGEAKVKRLQGLVVIDRTNEAVCFEKKDEAYGLLEKARGVAKSTCKRTNETKPVLEKEIKLFEKVIQLLKALSNGKKLVEEDQDEVKSFISLADQANPTKVKNVVTLVEGLIATANADIAKAIEDCGAANAAVDVAERVYEEAVGTCVPLTSKLEATERSLQNAQGTLETAKEHAVRRTPIIQSEIEALKEVISLITSVE